jgi:hypothetical protein
MIISLTLRQNIKETRTSDFDRSLYTLKLSYESVIEPEGMAPVPQTNLSETLISSTQFCEGRRLRCIAKPCLYCSK